MHCRERLPPGDGAGRESAIDCRSRKNIRQNAVRPGDAVGELPVEGEGQIGEASFTHRRGEPHALLGGLALVVSLHQRRVCRVPVGEELGSPLLDPAVEVGFRDAVRRGQERVIGNEEAHGRVLLGHLLRAPRQRGGVRRHRGRHVLLRLVEHDQVAAPACVFQEAPVVLEQVRPDGVGPGADHDRVEPEFCPGVGARRRRRKSAPWNGADSCRIGWASRGAVRR